MTPREQSELAEQGRGLRRLAGALVRDPGAADDVVQEAWVLALDRGALRDPGRTGGWLRGVVRNKVRERRRAEARRQSREQRAPGRGAAPRRPPTRSARRSSSRSA